MAFVGNDFTPFMTTRPEQCCSECGVFIGAGRAAFRAVRNGETQKIVCGPACAMNFNHRWYEYKARERARREPLRDVLRRPTVGGRRT